jgi:hypothetical protein
MFAGAPERFEGGSSVAFQAIGPRTSESWLFNIGSPEKMKLPGGELQVVRLVREPVGENEPRGEIWLAPAMGYLPVRIRLTQSNGDFVEQQWRSTQKP